MNFINIDLIIMIEIQRINVVRLCYFTEISETELIERKSLFLSHHFIYIYSFKFNSKKKKTTNKQANKKL